ncbi:hypothetical protein F4805DRAFT_11573 [Annulohypoxylon moriforme]|nr:hypothetical protein F4805DRAFT_11573 [Annulohypoxylon moriforme]
MKLPISLLLLTTYRALSQDTSNDTESTYITSVCSPTNQSPAPPCLAIQTIETLCLPNNTSPLALEAHAQCLCHGSYFAEWLGCRNCLLLHGALSPRNYTYFSSVLALASQDLCTGTPTAAFATLFTEAQASVPEPTAGGTELRDQRSGDAAVSLYYTASGVQGPGVITGSATAATATATSGTTASNVGSGSVGTGGSTGAGATASTGGSSATSSSSSGIAAATGSAGGVKGVLFAAAVGGAVVVAL